MQVSVETTGTLGRKITVQVPAQQIEEAVNARLLDLSRNVKLDGFRPGKVPMNVVKKKFDSRIRQEVVGEVMQSSLYEALVQENLKPAAGPMIENMTMEPGQALEYVATFEVYPEVQLASLEGKSVERPTASIEDADVDKMLEKLQKQRTTWNPVERPAQNDDQVVISFTGTIDGEAFAGNTAQDMPLVLGSGNMIPGFEEQLLGVQAGDQRTLEVKFPDDYQGKEVAGKTATFEVQVSKVNEPVLPEINDEFAHSFGMEAGLDAFRSEVRSNMERELKERIRNMTKTAVLDVLLQVNNIEVPGALIEEEIDNQLRQAYGNRPEALQNANLPRQLFEEQARRRVSLGLLVGEVIKNNGIELDKQAVRNRLEEIANTYDSPNEVIKAYSENKSLMQSLEGLVLEDQVVEVLLGQLNVQDKVMGFEELMDGTR